MADRACMALLRDRHVLLVRQTYRGKTLWTFPGGVIEPGETPMEAAIRETKEEVNLEVKAQRLLYQGARKNGVGTYYCYLGQILWGQIALGSDPELASDKQELREVRWFPVQEVREHPEIARILNSL